MDKIKKIIFPLLLFVFSIPAIYQLLKPGFYEPSDLHHLADIYQMFRAFQSGQMPPRLGPDFTFGWGYPLFNFYYVLPFYLGAGFFALFGSLTASYKFIFILSVLISLPAMYLFLREYFDKIPSFVGSFLYLYTPYRAVEIYVRGAMGEALAISLLPAVLWISIKIIKKPSLRLIAAGSLIIALFLLSHNYLWLLSLPFVGSILLIMVFLEKKKIISLLALKIAGLVAAGLTIFWWLPALLEQKLISSTTPFPLIDHFPFIRQLIIPSWGYGASLPGPYDGLSFQIGVVNLIVFIVSLLIIIFFRKLLTKKRLILSLWAILGFLVTVFMMNIRSYPIWKLIPFYNFVQFPWRLLFLTTLFTSVLASVIVQILPNKISKIFGIIIVLGALILTFNYFRPSKIFYKSDNDYLNRMFANRTVSGTKSTISQDYLNWSEDYLLLPKVASKKPNALPVSKIEGGKGVDVLNVDEINPVFWKGEVLAKNDGKVTFFAYSFPGWYTQLDRKEVKIDTGQPYGQIEVEVSKGMHDIEFFWKETPLRKTADLISLSSFVVCLGLFTFPIWKRKIILK